MFDDKVVVVTGTSKGIGNSIVRSFLNKNATVFACTSKDDHNSLLNLKKKEKSDKLNIVKFNLTEENEIKTAAKQIIDKCDGIDVIINNAGIIDTSLFQMIKIDDIKKIFEINFFSQLRFLQLILKKMIIRKKGSIINISSTAGIDTSTGRLAYSSSKAAMIIASKTLSKELSRNNIRVNVIAPGLTDTEMMHKNHNKQIIEDELKKISLKRIANPDEIANVCIFLASDASSYINGQVIRVDGGV